MTYTYSPELINDGGLNQLRFELGDVFTAEPAKEAYISDEEIIAALEGSKNFTWAKYRLLGTLLHRFAFECDTTVDKVSWKLSQRLQFWRDEYNRLRAKLEPVEELAGSNFGFVGKRHRPPAFSIAMFDR